MFENNKEIKSLRQKALVADITRSIATGYFGYTIPGKNFFAIGVACVVWLFSYMISDMATKRYYTASAKTETD